MIIVNRSSTYSVTGTIPSTLYTSYTLTLATSQNPMKKYNHHYSDFTDQGTKVQQG